MEVEQSRIYDLIISGSGVYGASCFYHASKAGKNVLLLEKSKAVNSEQSSYGESRITRQNVFEGQIYPQLAQKSQKIISEIEAQTGKQLQFFNGGLYIGSQKGQVIKNILENEHRCAKKLRRFSPREIEQNFPQFHIDQEVLGVLEETAGYIYNEEVVKSLIDLGLQSKNARFREECSYLGFEQKKDYICVYTSAGIYKCRKLIISNGIEMVNILKPFGVPIKIQKNQAAWLDLQDEIYQPEKLPIFYYDYSPEKQFYGFPNLGSGVKIGFHLRGDEYNDHRKANFDYDDDLLQELKQFYMKIFKIEDVKINYIRTCYYTMIQDEQFVVDFHPQNQNVVLLSCCSGHGFKYGAQIGLDAYNMTQTNQIPYKEFSIARFNFLNKAKL